MSVTIKKIGYGQVEPNHLSAQRTGQIYAQLKCHKKSGTSDTVETIALLENGMFVKYDLANNEINFTGKGENMLVFNEVKLYDGYRESYKDFALKAENFVDGDIVPRVFKTNVGDIFTTNCIGDATATNGVELSVGDQLVVNGSGYLVKGTATAGEVTGTLDTANEIFEVVKETTMPDGQPAVKVVRVK